MAQEGTTHNNRWSSCSRGRGGNILSLTFTALPSRMMVELWVWQAVFGIALLVASVTRNSTTRTTSGSTCGPILERSRTCAHTVPTAQDAQISCEYIYWRGTPIHPCEGSNSFGLCLLTSLHIYIERLTYWIIIVAVLLHINVNLYNSSISAYLFQRFYHKTVDKLGKSKAL